MVALFVAFLVSPAAGQESECDTQFDINRLIEGLDAADAALAVPSLAKARAILDALHTDVACLEDRVHPGHLVRYGRSRAVAAFFDQDELEMAYWAQLALLDPDLRWPEAITPDHPARDSVSFVDPVAPLALDDRGLADAKGALLLADGAAITTATIIPDAPHLMQQLDKDGRIRATFWQDGVVWREALLSAEAAPVEIPRWYTEPDPELNPYESVTIDPDVLAHRAESRAASDLARREAESQLDDALEKERLRSERREVKAARRAARESTEPVVVLQADGEPEPGDGEVAWVDLSFEEGAMDELDPLERGQATDDCDDLLLLEPRSLMGRLTEGQIICLEVRLRTAERQTTQNKLSRVLMADAWQKGDEHRWEGAVRRHLLKIDRSDADLCYIFARWLAGQEEEDIPEAIRWANVALGNAHQWEGQPRVDRMVALHRINAVAAQTLWLAAEDQVIEDTIPAHVAKASFWRNQTKNLAREWLQFATDADLETSLAYELCVSSAGTVEYCDVD